MSYIYLSASVSQFKKLKTKINTRRLKQLSVRRFVEIPIFEISAVLRMSSGDFNALWVDPLLKVLHSFSFRPLIFRCDGSIRPRF